MVWYLSLILESFQPVFLQIFFLSHSLYLPSAIPSTCMSHFLILSTVLGSFVLLFTLHLCFHLWSFHWPVYWWTCQRHSSFLILLLIHSISFWFKFFPRLSATISIWLCMLSTFSTGSFAMFIIVTLNSLYDNSNICVISESNFDDCFMSSHYVYSCLLVFLISFNVCRNPAMF